MVKSKKMAVQKGFTIIEVMFFIAISGMLLAGVLIGSSASISRQRYKDSVQDFAEFMRRIYSSVLNVEAQRSGPLYSNDICNINSQEAIRDFAAKKNIDEYGKDAGVDILKGLPGRTNCAYYGKLVTFNEADVANYSGEGYRIRVYDIIGKIYDPNVNKYKNTMDVMTGRVENGLGGVTFDKRQAINPESLVVTPDKSGNICKIKPASMNEYRMQWGAFLETAGKNRKAFKGSIAIIRSPETNQLQTFYSEKTLKLSEYGNEGDAQKEAQCSSFTSDNYKSYSLTEEFKNGSFKEDKDGVNFCINSQDGLLIGHPRGHLHVGYRASNSSAIDLLAEDNEKNLCNK